MLTRLVIRNFKLFGEVDIELGDRVVFVGPNNSGKTSALQALALWSTGIRRWVEKYPTGNVPNERPGATINRKDLLALPIPSAKLLWHDLHVREGARDNGKTKTKNLLIDVEVDGIDDGKTWHTAIELDYANEESFYCRSKVAVVGGERLEVPGAAAKVRLAYLPPMSGLAANEMRLDEGAIAVRIGEGRTAEVLRNLCWQAHQRTDKGPWIGIVDRMKALFGVELDPPQYVAERGEIAMSFKRGQTRLDLSASGRGQQQTLLLLAHMAANPGSVLLLDEPDAHLEILRQRQIYDVLTGTAQETGSQIIAASHSEVILNEAADRDIVVAFVGKPHRIDDRGSQVLKALKEIGFDQYLQAEQRGWILYLEGSTDLAILRAFAETLNHPSREHLERPYVHYVANHPARAREHFHGLREAKADLVGIALYDRLDVRLHEDPHLVQVMWKRREIENYLATRDVLRGYAHHLGKEQLGDLFAPTATKYMDAAIEEVAEALKTLGKPDPFGSDAKVSDEFLDPVFRKFFTKLSLPEATMRKTDYHTLAPYLDKTAIDGEIIEKLDQIVAVATRAKPLMDDSTQ